MHQQMANGDLARIGQIVKPGLVAQPLFDFVVERKLSVVRQADDRGRHKCLADAAGGHARVDGHFRAAFLVGQPAGKGHHATVGQYVCRRHARQFVFRTNGVEPGLKTHLKLCQTIIVGRRIVGMRGNSPASQHQSSANHNHLCDPCHV